MFRIFLLLGLAALSATAEPSVSLNGVITDPSGAPVPSARVLLTGRSSSMQRSAATDAAGRYRFDSLPASEYVLEASAEGFGATDARPVRLVETQTINLTLEISRVATRVQVTAAAAAQTVDEQSKALDIIDSLQLERRAEFSVAESLRTAPGLKVQQLGGPGSFTRILTRGMRATDTSLLIDGFRLRDAASPQADASAFLGDLLLAGTDRIEVLRGSGSSLYGTHATGGVVNVITDQGGGPIRGEAGFEGGGLGLLRPSARFSGSAWRDRLRFAGGAMHLNVTRGVDEDDRARNSTAHGFAALQLTPVTVVTGRVLVTDTFLQLNDAPYALTPLPGGLTVPASAGVTFAPSPNDPDSRRGGRNLNTMVALAHHWTPRVFSRFSYAGVSTYRDNRDGPAGTRFEPVFNESNRFDGRIDTAQARTDFQPDRRHLLTAGYEFEREFFDNRSRTENPFDPVNARVQIDQHSHAAFGQIQGRYFGERLQVLLSGRAQEFSLSRPQFSGNSPLYSGMALPDPPGARTGDASVAWTFPRSGTRLRGHIGNGYRAPALYERFGASFFLGSFSAYGDPALSPERLLAFDGGFDQYLASSRVRVSGTYFYTRIQQAIIFDFSGAIVPATDPYNRFGGYRNSGGGLARGVEMSVEATPYRSLTVHTSYTYTNADDRVSQYNNGMLRSIRNSDHMFTAFVSQRIGRRFDLTYDMFAASNYLIPFSGRAFVFPGLVKADLSASWTQPLSDRHSVRFHARVENVLNRTYYEEGFRTPKAWAVGGIKWMF